MADTETDPRADMPNFGNFTLEGFWPKDFLTQKVPYSSSQFLTEHGCAHLAGVSPPQYCLTPSG